MKLYLRENVNKLGKAGELVDVSDGYARNFLLPRNLAFLHTPENELRVKSEAKRRNAKELARIESITELAKAVNGKEITLKARANEEDKLFGSIGVAQIVETLLADYGAQVDMAAVALPEPIRELGVFDVTLNLAEGIESIIKVWVVQES